LTKHQDGKRDPEMCQTRKGNPWHFGLKAHIGVDSNNKLVHSAAVTAANVHDSRLPAVLLHGGETRVRRDSAYGGQGEALVEYAPQAQDFTHARAYRNAPLTEEDKRKNRTRSKVRARVEHLFRVLKCQFGFTRVRYRGLQKNARYLVRGVRAGEYRPGETATIANITGVMRLRQAGRPDNG